MEFFDCEETRENRMARKRMGDEGQQEDEREKKKKRVDYDDRVGPRMARTRRKNVNEMRRGGEEVGIPTYRGESKDTNYSLKGGERTR